MSLNLTPKSSPAAGYPALVKNIQKELGALDFFIKRRTAESYWKVGKFIHEYLLENKDRADYGNQLFKRLANDVDRDASTLSKTVRFYRVYPILASGPKLSWSHYRALMAVKDKEERKKLEEKIIQKNWDAQKLQEYLAQKREIEVVKADSQGTVPTLSFTRGRPRVYRVVTVPGKEGLFLDLGFRVRHALVEVKGGHLKEEDCVEIVKKEGAWTFQRIEIAKEELFTYLAEVIKVVDGDTLLVLIDAGFDNFLEQRIRLKGIDCPEAGTPEGQKAKRFVSSRLNKLDFVIVKTHKDSTDKYDRYLADIFYESSAVSLQQSEKNSAASRELKADSLNYLNQELLDEHLAVLYE